MEPVKKKLSQKPIFAFMMGVVMGIMLTLIVGVGIVVFNGVGGMMTPVVYTDEAVRTRIENFGIPVPETAGNLYYCSWEFQEGVFHIGMTTTPTEAWTVIHSYLGKDQNDFKPLEPRHGIGDPGSSHGDEYKTDLWRIENMKSPVYCIVDTGGGNKAAIYDEATHRLLLYYADY